MLPFPVEGFPGRDFRITQHFDTKVDYTKSGIHGGIDLAPRVPGTKNVVLYASHEGYVGIASSPMLGNHIRITSLPYNKEGQMRRTVYAHCEKMLVEDGAFVHQGDKIAIMGTTGHSTGIHCHFEYYVFKNNKWELVNIEPYLYAFHFSH